MILKAICTKCNNEGKIDTGNLSKEETLEKLKTLNFGECPFGGFHVEIGKMTDYIKIIE